MKKFKVRLSLRYKLLALLVSLPLVSLGLYLVMATELFQKDKVAYVFDSTATVSRSLATQVRMETQSIYAAVRTIVDNFDIATNDFNAVAKSLMQTNTRAQAVILLRRQAEGQYLRMGALTAENPEAKTFATDESDINRIGDRAGRATAFFQEYASQPGSIVAAYRLGQSTDPNPLIIVSLYKAQELLAAFETTGSSISFAATRDGQPVFGAMDVVTTDMDLLHGILNSKAAEGTAEATLSDRVKYLISYANVGVGDLMVITKVDKMKALKAVEVLIAKSLLFFVALIASTLLISVFASNQLTSQIRELFDATAKVAQGDFNVSVKPRSHDEVGGLAESFNWMAAEVSRLMSETAEKARMESELSTVRTVQETLFPAPSSQFGPIQIEGHFEPASECGGDWWNYSRIGNKIFLWIGDATGHGAPAALITSAARSAAAVIEAMPDVTPGMALTILNRAIHQTSKGQIMMTFFIACIDLDHKVFSYASASHDPPYLLRRSGEKISKKDLVPLNEVNGPRLGERKDHRYEETSLDFQPGDLLFFYTDGIIDVQDPKGRKWGERQFLKTLVESANSEGTLDQKLGHLRSNIEQFRSGSALIDDVTMVMCEYGKRAA